MSSHPPSRSHPLPPAVPTGGTEASERPAEPAPPSADPGEGVFHVRRATAADLPAIVALHAADPHGHGDAWTGETRPAYELALARLEATPGHTLWVAEWRGRVAGTFLLSLLPGITGRGAMAAELRSVQVSAALRSQGIGRRMVAEAERIAREAGAATMELTSNLRRTDAHRFYEREGYARSHAGFKKTL